MQILVLGYIVRGPLGGMCWHHLQYVLGLHNMGHTVLYLEDSDDYPCCYNPKTFRTDTDPSYGLAFIQRLFESFDLHHHWAYFCAHSNQWFGKTSRQVADFCANADVVINLSGINPVRNFWCNIPRRIFVDTDPAFTQIKHLTDPAAKQLAEAHNAFFTFGENYNKPGCQIPKDDLRWLPTRQPLVKNAWPKIEALPSASFTTVMQWDSYKSYNYNNQFFGMKSASFQAFLTLPARAGNQKLQLAIGGPAAPLQLLKDNNWQLVDSLSVTISPGCYQNYIQRSMGEWSIAKQGYVVSNSGWFSERSVAYLASGKPVIVQDTGFSMFLPVGEGLLAFSNIDEAEDAIARVSRDYKNHCESAERIATEFFDHELVLKNLLNTN